jgi:hypothetical protein
MIDESVHGLYPVQKNLFLWSSQVYVGDRHGDRQPYPALG